LKNIKIEIRKLTPECIKRVEDLAEVMKAEEGQVRGYGYIGIKVEEYFFAIPLRSHMNHEHGFRFIGNKGLDYTKAIIINPETDLAGHFSIDNNEFSIIYKNRFQIYKEFEIYVSGYIKMKKGAYTRTTLQNYHNEFKIDI